MSPFAQFFFKRYYRNHQLAVFATKVFSVFGLRRMYRWYWVEDGRLARSGQMYGAHVDTMLRREGIKAVVNLRGENPISWWYPHEKAVCEKLGIEHYDVEVSTKRLPEQKTLLAVIDAMAGAAKPVLAKCDGGADRTGLAVALNLLDTHGFDVLERAKSQLSLGLFHGKKKWQRWIPALFDFFQADRDGRDIRPWIAEAYTPDRFAEFLRARGQGDYWKP